MCDLDPTVDGMLPHANALCILRYEPDGGRQVDTEEDGEGQHEAGPGADRTGPGTGQPASLPEPARGTGSQAGPPKPSRLRDRVQFRPAAGANRLPPVEPAHEPASRS